MKFSQESQHRREKKVKRKFSQKAEKFKQRLSSF